MQTIISAWLMTSFILVPSVIAQPATLPATEGTGFHLPEDPTYTILDSARDSVRFAAWTLVPHRGHLASKSSFVDSTGAVMGWHEFGHLEGPGWAANAVGGAYELFRFAEFSGDEALPRPERQKLRSALLRH